MNQTTETPTTTKTKLGKSHTMILWIIIIVCGGILPSLVFRTYHAMHDFFLTPFPWVIEGGITINHGLQMVSGKIPEAPTLTLQLSFLMSVVIMFVIAPTLFLFGVRQRAIERDSGKEFHIIRWSSVYLVLGGIVIIGPATQSIPISIIHRQVSSSLREGQAKAENKDNILYELNTIAIRLYEYRVLPKEYGGGNGSMAGFALPKELSTTLEAQYTVEIQDSLAIVKATSVKYSQGMIMAKINTTGKFLEWKYSEFFE